jgi:hypothetical protein
LRLWSNLQRGQIGAGGPQSAIQLDQAGRYVLVVDEAKKVELRRVTTGVEQGRDIVVTEGLKPFENFGPTAKSLRIRLVNRHATDCRAKTGGKIVFFWPRHAA